MYLLLPSTAGIMHRQIGGIVDRNVGLNFVSFLAKTEQWRAYDIIHENRCKVFKNRIYKQI